MCKNTQKIVENLYKRTKNTLKVKHFEEWLFKSSTCTNKLYLIDIYLVKVYWYIQEKSGTSDWQFETLTSRMHKYSCTGSVLAIHFTIALYVYGCVYLLHSMPVHVSGKNSYDCYTFDLYDSLNICVQSSEQIRLLADANTRK